MTKTLDLVISIGGKQEAQSITPEDRDPLFGKPVVETKRSKRGGSIPRAVIVQPTKSELEEFTLQDIATGYEELLSQAEGLLDRLTKRVGVLTYDFDPAQLPALSEAVSETFVGESKRITFQMYLQALRLDSELATLIGEESHGTWQSS